METNLFNAAETEAYMVSGEPGTGRDLPAVIRNKAARSHPVPEPPPFDSLPEWDISTVAEELFRVWDDGSELRWADNAWKHIVAARLAEGENGELAFGVERCRVTLRFLALATLFRDWCSLVTELEPTGQIQSFIEDLGIDPFYLGLMLDLQTSLDDTDAYDEYNERCALESALHILVKRERPVVAQTLLQGFGGPDKLFVSLWRARYPHPDGDSEFFMDTDYALRGVRDDFNERQDAVNESDEAILNLSTPEKLRAWDWINQGCPPLE